MCPPEFFFPEFIDETSDFLYRELPATVDAALILGSGLGSFTQKMNIIARIPYEQIPHFPVSSVAGHAGQLILGELENKTVLTFSGRFHFYEGYSLEETVLPVYVSKKLKASKLIISNAAGAINTRFKVGDLMVVEDILRQNVAITPPGAARYRFNPNAIIQKTRKIASNLSLDIQRGNYLYAKGPNYETKAEIRAFRVMGADAVGMSTAPELFEASRLKLKAVAISLISNMAAGVNPGKLCHNEVKEAAALREKDFAVLIKALTQRL